MQELGCNPVSLMLNVVMIRSDTDQSRHTPNLGNSKANDTVNPDIIPGVEAGLRSRAGMLQTELYNVMLSNVRSTYAKPESLRLGTYPW